MVQSVLVLGAGVPYDIEDKEAGKRVRGRKVWYIMRSAPLQGEAVGFSAVSASVSAEVGQKIKGPGTYNGAFEFKTNKDGKLEAKLVDVDEKSYVKVEL